MSDQSALTIGLDIGTPVTKAGLFDAAGREIDSAEGDRPGFLPNLGLAGIIAPQAEPRVPGGFSGLTTDHGRTHLVRAVYEGVMLPSRAAPRRWAPRRRRSVWSAAADEAGSGARCWPTSWAVRFWCRKARNSARGGAALLAATATGRYGSVQAAAAAPLAVRRHDPDPTHFAAYAASRERYEQASRAFIETIARRG